MARIHRPSGHSALRLGAGVISLVADGVIGVALARAGTRVSSASVSAASTGAALVTVSELRGTRPPTSSSGRSTAGTLRSSASTVGWAGLAWCAATLAEDRNIGKAPLGPALAALQGVTLLTGSTWPNRIAGSLAQVATGVILSGAAARHEDPAGGVIALSGATMQTFGHLVGLSRTESAQTAKAILDSAARVSLAVTSVRLANVGDERLF
jgi:hypothetical protein